MSKIEDLIKAIHYGLGGDGWAYSNYGNDELHDKRDALESAARAALLAIREPDEGMVDAAVHAFSGHNSLESSAKRMRKVVTAAIDRALTQETSE